MAVASWSTQDELEFIKDLVLGGKVQALRNYRELVESGCRVFPPPMDSARIRSSLQAACAVFEPQIQHKDIIG
jgi:hypothetical protein